MGVRDRLPRRGLVAGLACPPKQVDGLLAQAELLVGSGPLLERLVRVRPDEPGHHVQHFVAERSGILRGLVQYL